MLRNVSSARSGGLIRFVLLALTASCGGKKEAVGPESVARLTVAPATVALQGIGVSQSVQATALDRRGNPVSGPAVSWSSSSPGVASVSGSGLSATVTSVTPGTATITATSGSATASATVTVSAELRSVSAGVSSIALDLTAGGRTRALAATASADVGVVTTFEWTSSAPGVVSVSSRTGASTTLTAITPGNATVTLRGTAQFGGTTRTAEIAVTVTGSVRSITVTPPSASLTVPQTLQLGVTVDADAGVSQGVTWVSSAPTVASVSTSGLVTALAPGTAVISARSVVNASVVGQSTIEVRNVPRIVAVTPKTASIPVGATTPLAAAVSGEVGFPSTVTWTSRTTAVATVSTQGVVTGVAAGSATIVATSTADAAARDSAVVTVTAVVLPQAVTSWQVTIPDAGGVGGRPFVNVSAVGVTAGGDPLVAADCGLYRYSGAAWIPMPVATCVTFIKGSLVYGSNGIVHEVGTGPTPSITQVSLALPGSAQLGDLARVCTGGVIIGSPVFCGLAAVTPSGTLFSTSTFFAEGTVPPAPVTWGNGQVIPGVGTQTVFSIEGRRAISNVLVGAGGGTLLLGQVLAATALGNFAPIAGLPNTAQVRGLYCAPTADCFLATNTGVYRLTGLTLTSLAAQNVVSVQGLSATDVFFGGGGLFRFDGTSFSAFGTVPAGSSTYGIAATEVVFGGLEGLVARAPRSAPNTATRIALNPNWNDVSVTATNHAVAVGNHGTIARWNGATWTAENKGTEAFLGGVHSLGPTQTWAAGSEGVWFGNGSSWSLVAPSTIPMRAIHVFSPTNIVAAGDQGQVLRFDGASWLRSGTGTIENLHSVWGGAPDNYYVGGTNGAMRRFTGTGFVAQPLDPTAQTTIYNIHGASATDVMAVTDGRFYRLSTGRFFGEAAQLSRAIWAPASTDIYAASQCVRRLEASLWPIQVCSPYTIHSIDGLPTGGAIAVGEGGRVLLGRNSTSGFFRVGAEWPLTMAAQPSPARRMLLAKCPAESLATASQVACQK